MRTSWTYKGEPMMDIYAKKETKVRFTGIGGYEGEKQFAKKHLTIDKIYTVECTVVHNWSSTVYLKEKPGLGFNTVLFSEVKENEWLENAKKQDLTMQQQEKKFMELARLNSILDLISQLRVYVTNIPNYNQRILDQVDTLEAEIYTLMKKRESENG